MSVDEPSFHRFNRLPAEIRLQIWSLHHGRIIAIEPSRYGFKMRSRSSPSLLHVNRESRMYVERTYELVDFAPAEGAADPDGPSHTTNATRHAMIDWTKDTLYLGPVHRFSTISAMATAASLSRPSALRKAQYLAIPALKNWWLRQFVTVLPGLRGITIVDNDDLGLYGLGLDCYSVECFYFARIAPVTKGFIDIAQWLIRSHQSIELLNVPVRICDVVHGTSVTERLRNEDSTFAYPADLVP